MGQAVGPLVKRFIAAALLLKDRRHTRRRTLDLLFKQAMENRLLFTEVPCLRMTVPGLFARDIEQFVFPALEFGHVEGRTHAVCPSFCRVTVSSCLNLFADMVCTPADVVAPGTASVTPSCGPAICKKSDTRCSGWAVMDATN